MGVARIDLPPVPEGASDYELWARAYRWRPADFARDNIAWAAGEGLETYQAEALDTLVDAGRLAIRSPHGVGKTTTDALAVLWFALTRDGLPGSWKCLTTASAWRQLTLYLWPEIHAWSRRLKWGPGGIPRAPFMEGRELQKHNLVLRRGAASAVAATDPAKIEGGHADSILYVLDEAKMIPTKAWDAIEGAFSGAGSETPREAFALATSTPTDADVPAGKFYDIHRRKTGLTEWAVRHITLAEGIAAGRISAEWAEARRLDWGETSPMYVARVLGDFPAGSSRGVIPLSAVEAAVERWWHLHARNKIPDDWDTAALDVADGGAARSILALGRGDIVVDLLDVTRAEAAQHMELVGVVRPYLLPGVRFRPDASGPGSGVISRIQELIAEGALPRLTIEPFRSGEATSVTDRSGSLEFHNVRAAAWWGLREELDLVSGCNLAIPPDDDLIADLTTPTWKATSRGKILIEAKKEIDRTLDHGDAVVMLRWRGEPVVVSAGVAPPPPAPRQTASGRAVSHLHASRPHLQASRGRRPTRNRGR